MKIKKIVSMMALMIISFSSHAEERIDGAFGLKLGDTFDKQSAISQGELTDGTPMYQFTPSKSFRSFTRYYALITPKTNKIYSIWGIGSIENDPSCKKEQALVMSILQKKYGKPEKDGFTASLYDIKNIDQGDRYVLTKCNGYSDVTLDIRYRDNKLAELAENERIVLESEKLDSSGL